jgi:tetratricopeptide (TPR) repeat protein
LPPPLDLCNYLKMQTRAINLLGAFCLFCVLAAKPAGAVESDSFGALIEKANTTFAAGDFSAAKPQYEAALAAGKNSSVKKPDLAVILSDIAIIEKMQNRLEQAQDCLEDAIPMAGDDEQLVALLHTRLGSVCRARGNFYGALDHAQLALTLRRKLNTDSTLLAEALNNLAVSNLDLKHYKEALALCTEALAIVKSAGKSGGAEETAVLATRAAALSETGDFEGARAMFVTILAAQEKLYGESSVKLAGTLSNLASTYIRQNQFVEAKPFLERALSNALASTPPDKAAAADACVELARCCSKTKDNAGAHSYYKRAISFAEEINYKRLPSIKQQYQLFIAVDKGFIEDDNDL